MMVGLDKENPGASSRPGLSNFAERNISRTKEKDQLYLVYPDDGDPCEVRASGRFDWPHEGPIPGKHGRYVLQSLVLKGGAA